MKKRKQNYYYLAFILLFLFSLNGFSIPGANQTWTPPNNRQRQNHSQSSENSSANTNNSSQRNRNNRRIINHEYYQSQLNSLSAKIQSSHLNVITQLKTLAELVSSSSGIQENKIKIKKMLKSSRMFSAMFLAYAAKAGNPRKKRLMLWYRKKRNKLARINPNYRRFNYLLMRWFLRPLRTKKLYYTNPYRDEIRHTMMISATFPVFKDGRILGVVGADIPLKRLVHNIQSLRFGKKGFAFLVKGNGILLAHPNKKYVGKKNIFRFSDPDSLFNTGEPNVQINALARVMLKQRKKTKASIVDSHSGIKYIAYFTPITGTDWALCIMIRTK